MPSPLSRPWIPASGMVSPAVPPSLTLPLKGGGDVSPGRVGLRPVTANHQFSPSLKQTLIPFMVVPRASMDLEK